MGPESALLCMTPRSIFVHVFTVSSSIPFSSYRSHISPVSRFSPHHVMSMAYLHDFGRAIKFQPTKAPFSYVLKIPVRRKVSPLIASVQRL